LNGMLLLRCCLLGLLLGLLLAVMLMLGLLVQLLRSLLVLNPLDLQRHVQLRMAGDWEAVLRLHCLQLSLGNAGDRQRGGMEPARSSNLSGLHCGYGPDRGLDGNAPCSPVLRGNGKLLGEAEASSVVDRGGGGCVVLRGALGNRHGTSCSRHLAGMELLPLLLELRRLPPIHFHLLLGVLSHLLRERLVSLVPHQAVVPRRPVLELLPRHVVGGLALSHSRIVLGFLGRRLPLLGQFPEGINHREMLHIPPLLHTHAGGGSSFGNRLD